MCLNYALSGLPCLPSYSALIFYTQYLCAYCFHNVCPTHGRPTSINQFKNFGSKCYIKRNEDNLGKFDSRDDEGILLGYSSRSKGYRCNNKRLHKIIENIDVKVDEGPLHSMRHQHHNEQYDEPINNELLDDGMGEQQ
jgi:hypothetical protein